MRARCKTLGCNQVRTRFSIRSGCGLWHVAPDHGAWGSSHYRLHAGHARASVGEERGETVGEGLMVRPEKKQGVTGGCGW